MSRLGDDESYPGVFIVFFLKTYQEDGFRLLGSRLGEVLLLFLLGSRLLQTLLLFRYFEVLVVYAADGYGVAAEVHD